MKLYLPDLDSIYFPQIKEYFKEIVSSYDNGNYRSAMVMLYSTIVCDLLLKLKELSEVYSDTKAESMLKEVEKQRNNATDSRWEWNLINKIHQETEILSEESYIVVRQIYDWRNISAHPALDDDYQLVTPTAEITVAFITKALGDIFTKPSVFAKSIVDRMSNDIAAKKEIYRGDYNSFKSYLEKVYFPRMSTKMINQVFKAFWKFTFLKSDNDAVLRENRNANRVALHVMLDDFGDIICQFIQNNPIYFSVSTDTICLKHLCILLSYYPKVFRSLDSHTQYQVKTFSEDNYEIVKWFINGDLEQHVASFQTNTDILPANLLLVFKRVCDRQGMPHLFPRLLINHFSNSGSYVSTRDRFDHVLSNYLDSFGADNFIQLIATINGNPEIYDYVGQKQRNDIILQYARPLLPDTFDYSIYPNFKYTEQIEHGDSGFPAEIDIEEIEDEYGDDLPF